MKSFIFVSGIGNWIPPPHSKHDVIYGEDPNSFKPVKNIWLFNIKADPNEHSDLSGSHPDIVKMMLDKLAGYQATAVPCRFPPKDKKANPKFHGGYWGPWE